MILIELYVPHGTLTSEQRRSVGEALVTALVPADVDAPAEAIAAARAYTQVLIHEPATWIVGGAQVGPVEQARYFVRITVPGSWRKELSTYAIPQVTQVLATIDPDPQRLYSEPCAWVQVIGVSEGSCGLFGQPMGSTDIVRVMTKAHREQGTNHRTDDLAPGTALDPTCGMVVPLSDAAAVEEADGATYAFCSSACHAVFEQDRRAATR